MGEVTIAGAQRLAWENKRAKGFNTADVAFEFGLLTAEIGEAFTAWRTGAEGFGEELADVFLYLAGLAEMAGVDLGAEVAGKLAVNAGRRYVRNGAGSMVKADDASSPIGGA